MSEINHSKECSITPPEDRDKENRWKPDQFAPPLEGDQYKEAVKELNDISIMSKFSRVDRTYADPAVPLQVISLFSFMPAKGAKPNDNGVYGFAKIRGTYGTELESVQRAEFIIKNVDSYNKIQHVYVGRPFPITLDSKYAAETDEIDIKKEMTKAVSQNIKDKKDDEYKTIQEIKQKEEALLEDSKKETEDPYEEYITQRVKLAQLSFTYLEHQKKMVEIRGIVVKTRERVGDMDKEFPTFKENYYNKYMDAREKAGIKESKDDTQTNFIKYLVQEAPLDF